MRTCLYSGMDTYQKIWLQFAFPLYICLLVGAIILVSRYAITAVKVFVKNSISLLATLFLLSYTKILKTIITALDSTEVLQANASDTNDPLVLYKVWTHDGNIEYLSGKHSYTVVCSILVDATLPVSSIHPAAPPRTMDTLLFNTEKICTPFHTQHCIHLHHGCLPCSLHQETSLLDWPPATGTLYYLPCFCSIIFCWLTCTLQLWF